MFKNIKSLDHSSEKTDKKIINSNIDNNNIIKENVIINSHPIQSKIPEPECINLVFYFLFFKI